MKYGQKVRVTSGFYEGMEGTLKDEIGTDFQYKTPDDKISFLNAYIVELDEAGKQVEFLESSLERIESSKDREIKKISEQLQNELISSLELIK